MFYRIYPAELQLSKPSSSDTEVSLLDINLPISNSTVFTTVYVKRMISILISLISRTLKAMHLVEPLME